MNVLIIEDDDDDARMIQEALAGGNADCRTQRAVRLDEALALLGRLHFDAVILDLALPDSDGRDTFARFVSHLRRVPVLIVTSLADPLVAKMAVRAGAQDYVVKEELRSYPLVRAVTHAVERFRAAAALRQSQDRYRLLFEMLPTPSFVFDQETLRILAINEAAVRLYGWSREELLGMTLHDIRPSEEVPVLRRAQDEWRRGEEPMILESVRHRAKDGRDIYVNVTTQPFDMDGRRARIALVTDVTERRRADAVELERAALRDTVEAMDRVLGVVSHELRTPLAGLRAISELVLTREVNSGAETRTMLRSLHDEVVRMSDTVDALLEAARLNSGRAAWTWSRFPVGRVCLEAIEGVRPLVDGRGVDLQVDVEPALVEMRGDAGAVRRLLLNLLSNARKHTRRGHVRVSVREWTDDEAAAEGSWVLLRVTDTGSGIRPEVRARLGQPFALNSGVVGTDYVGGTGLGLSICRGIVEAHGGVLSVESEPGRGTSVTVRLRSDLAGPVVVTPKSYVGQGQAA